MNVVKAVRPMQPVNNGVTKPFVLLCDDGNQYYTKFKQNPEGTRVLANEYVCAKLADQLKLPLANPTLINVDKDFIDLYGKTISDHIECEEELSKGLHFGTKKINKAFQISNAKMIESATNIQVIPEIILFDQLVCNTDRDCNGGNLIFDQSNMQIVVIDHSHVFEIGTLWDATQLNIRIGSKFEPFTQNGYIFRKLVPFVRGYNPFDPIMGKMSGISNEFLWHIINEIPDEWTIPLDDKKALHSYLGDRLHRIEDALPVLKPILPYWKGGI